MRRHALRPAAGLTRTDFYRSIETISTSTRSAFFSTTQPSYQDPNDGRAKPPPPPRAPPARPALGAARKEVRRIVQQERVRIGETQASRGGSYARGGGRGGAGGQKVINLTSLPKGFASKLKGLKTGVQGSPDTMNPQNFVPMSGRGRGFGPRDFGRGRGGGGARGGRGGRGGVGFGAGGGARGRGDRGRGNRSRGGYGAGGASSSHQSGTKSQDSKGIDSAMGENAETEMARSDRIAREVGISTPYDPQTSLETLIPYLPEVATDSNPLGRIATAITNLRVVAGGIVDTSPLVNSDEMWRDYRKKGAIFYADPKTKERIEWGLPPGKNIMPVGEEVKEAITRRAIKGEYDEKTKQTVDFKDPLGLSRRYHAKEQTYFRKDGEQFEKKLVELISKGKGGAPKAKAKMA